MATTGVNKFLRHPTGTADFHTGHNIEDAGEDDDLVIPEVVAGAYVGRVAGGPQHFLRTDSRLEQGQCGAPVISGSACVGGVE